MAAPVVLITGAAHRLGAHTAETLHGRGWNVVIHYRSRQEQARQLIDKLNRERADSATSVQADLTNPEDLARLAKTACNHWQRLDGLVNNASVFYPNPTENATEDDWQGIMGANLKAPFFLLQHCHPTMVALAPRRFTATMPAIYFKRGGPVPSLPTTTEISHA